MTVEKLKEILSLVNNEYEVCVWNYDGNYGEDLPVNSIDIDHQAKKIVIR